MKLWIIILIFYVGLCQSADKFALRELHVLFQKSDQNKDHFLDQKELSRFVESFMKKLPNIFKSLQVNNDAIEGGKVLAEEMFERKDRNEDSKLDFRGSLISKSEATNFGDELEKTLINLVHEIAGKSQPYPSVNPFAHDNRKKRNTVVTQKPMEIEKNGTPTIRELPNPLVKIQDTNI